MTTQKEAEAFLRKRHAELKEMVKHEEEWLTLYGTLLVCGMDMADLISKNLDFLDVPIHSRYRMALAVSNFFAYMHVEPGDKMKHFQYVDADQIAELQDVFAKRLGFVVKSLYENCKEAGIIK
jgi:hypothetical protein